MAEGSKVYARTLNKIEERNLLYFFVCKTFQVITLLGHLLGQNIVFIKIQNCT